ncbi:MAG TPA: ATP-grasp domain-containing protein [Actinocatenispora sp.]
MGSAVGLIDHDALMAGDIDRAVAGVPAGGDAAWFRGWMLSPERYGQLWEALARRGGGLLVSPEQYRAAHELPGWYTAFAAVTPASVWRAHAPGEAPAADRLAAMARCLPSGPGIVKDYVKSRKHEWEEACYVPDLADTDRLRQVVGRFVELQDQFLAGGIVLRAFERFVAPEGLAAEVRVWWLDARPVLVSPHPDSTYTQCVTPDLDQVRDAVSTLDCRLVTTDLAQRADGMLRVVEVGDGQVSDLHQAADLAGFAEMLTGP